MEFFKFKGGSVFTSGKSIKVQRGKSPFIQGILNEGLEVGEYTYRSHASWLESLTQQGKDLSTMAVGSLKNGPRYTLARMGYNCIAVNLLDADERDVVAKHEGRELSEKDIVYAITKNSDNDND